MPILLIAFLTIDTILLIFNPDVVFNLLMFQLGFIVIYYTVRPSKKHVFIPLKK